MRRLGTRTVRSRGHARWSRGTRFVGMPGVARAVGRAGRRERTSKTSPEGPTRSCPRARKAKRPSASTRPIRRSCTTRSRRSGGNVTQALIEKYYLSEKFGVNAGGGVLRTETPKAGR